MSATTLNHALSFCPCLGKGGKDQYLKDINAGVNMGPCYGLYTLQAKSVDSACFRRRQLLLHLRWWRRGGLDARAAPRKGHRNRPA